MIEDIVLIECESMIYDNNIPTGNTEILVSHGVGVKTLKTYILPQQSIDYFDWEWSNGEKVLKG